MDDRNRHRIGGHQGAAREFDHQMLADQLTMHRTDHLLPRLGTLQRVGEATTCRAVGRMLGLGMHELHRGQTGLESRVLPLGQEVGGKGTHKDQVQRCDTSSRP